MKLLALALALCFTGCMAQSPSPLNGALEVTTVLDLHDKDYNPHRVHRKFYVIEKDSLNIFRVPSLELFGKTTVDDFGNLETAIDSAEYHFYHVLFKPGQKFGYTCDSLGRDWRKIPIDSFIATNVEYGLDVLVDRLGNNDTLVSKAASEDGKVLTEKYATKSKPNLTYSDSTIAVYDGKLNHYRFSFSPRADQAKQRKLRRFVKVFNADPAGEYMFLRENRYYVFEIKEVDIPKPEIMDKLVSMYHDLEKNKSGH